ncbi:Type 1 glutamine amidotransferase-like domain-containing protein [Nostoc sp. FACHB-87]|uniref:cyanophycinase n=1 Tax=Nostocaceae TaxID=1162 RepID=UPI0016873C92|nr:MULTISPECIES: Type 1 glutamine amidotransferase-like domain-containing protein [Nostocaceae]MBD2456471.1 Type 1 glutamine amidotransferase-like domain-containing protein [Nostoc sp. FACHB-87]MBD2473985.1 Type 1 glutamine amidotransferase-like domain-containing protein [Anabaena sp. FACHB-83]
MTKAFPDIAKFWKNLGTVLLRMGASLITRLTAYLKRHFIDNTVDVVPPLSHLPRLAGPVLNLGGGGPDVEKAIQWMIDQVRGDTSSSANKVDVVVLRAYGSEDYNHLIYGMRGVNSVKTLIISNRNDANREDIVTKVRKAGVVFFAGGDQCQYIRSWKNTKLENAVREVYARGGAIGGTSAGAMIHSEYIYDSCACEDSIETREILEDPYRNITFTYDFFQWGHLRGTIIDTHFDSRKRMGRIMAFIARQIQDGKANRVLGIAISEETSLVIDKYGLAKVMGRNAAYFVLGDHPPEICKPRTPLTYHDYKIWRVPSGDTFDLRNPPNRGYYFRSVKRGRFNSDPY